MSKVNNINRKGKFYLAFPGMGKTPLCQKNPRFIDLDFGTFREALKVPKPKEVQIMPNFKTFVEYYLNEGFDVISNDPKLVKFIKCSHMYLPSNPTYSAKKMDVSEDQIIEWSKDWENLAKQYHVPVTWISTGLDKYLK